MRWEKQGNIFQVNESSEWMRSHASLPTPVHLKDDTFRIFFSTRGPNNVSRGAYFDFDVEKRKVIAISENPVLEPGALGLFDDCGVSLACYVREINTFYYMGWYLPKNVPFSNQIGAARFADSKLEKLEKTSILPVLGKCEKEPFSFGYPWVTKFKGKFLMWYDSNPWWKSNSTSEYFFQLRMAESEDGIQWKKKYVDGFPMNPGERSVARPCVLVSGDILKMWYSVNTEGKYSIGYAESGDGITWTRHNENGGVSKSATATDWDSDEVEYPCVFEHKGTYYMLYNGNSYGKTGVGLARLVEGG